MRRCVDALHVSLRLCHTGHDDPQSTPICDFVNALCAAWLFADTATCALRDAASHVSAHAPAKANS